MKEVELLEGSSYEKEYFMLRTEIMQNLKYSYHIELGAVASTVGAISFLFESNEPLLFYLPLMWIYPMFIKSNSITDANCKIAMYLVLFLEEAHINWCRRLYELEKMINKNSTTASDVYIWLVACCGMFSIISWYNKVTFEFVWFIKNEMMLLQFFLIVLLLVSSINVIKRKRYKAFKRKEYYDHMWKKVKAENDIRNRVTGE